MKKQEQPTKEKPKEKKSQPTKETNPKSTSNMYDLLDNPNLKVDSKICGKSKGKRQIS